MVNHKYPVIFRLIMELKLKCLVQPRLISWAHQEFAWTSVIQLMCWVQAPGRDIAMQTGKIHYGDYLRESIGGFNSSGVVVKYYKRVSRDIESSVYVSVKINYLYYVTGVPLTSLQGD